MMTKSKSTWNEIFNLQKKIYLSNKKLIKDLEPLKSQSFLKYEKRYLKSVKSYHKISSFEEVIQQIKKSDIILVGDYHTLNQSQRSLLRLIRSLFDEKIHFNLCLELFRVKHQKWIEEYLRYKIDEKKLKTKIGFSGDWFFDFWNQFVPILDFCRIKEIDLFGIESNDKDKMTLSERDRFFAKEILDVWKNNSEKKTIVHVGDLHLAKAHLPREISKLDSQIKVLTLYQNSESIYWDLAEKELVSKTVVVKISDQEYCRINTPPILVQQSYINWLEHEEESIDYDQASYVFRKYFKKLSQFFNVNVDDEVEKIEVFTCDDFSFLNRIKKSKYYSDTEYQEIVRQILESKSYYVKKLHFVYLADLSINYVAEQAMNALRFLHHTDENPRSDRTAFYLAVINQMLAYLGSKIINHHRKCLRPFLVQKILNNMKKRKKDMSHYSDEIVYRYFLKHQRLIRSHQLFSQKQISSLNTDQYRKLIKIIGNYSGERIFYALLEKYISKDQIKMMIINTFDEHEPNDLIEVFLDLIIKSYKIRIPRRV